MNKIQKLIVSMKVVIHLWKMGFYFSENTHKSKGDDCLGSFWGFYRLNWEQEGCKPVYSVLDIDFSEEIPDDEYFCKTSYAHMHADHSIFRFDKYSDGKIETKCKMEDFYGKHGVSLH